MAQAVERGQIWLLELPSSDKRRPVLILSRQTLIDVLHTVTVAAITGTGRGSPTEVELGVADGLKKTSFVNLINVFTVPKTSLLRFVGEVSSKKLALVCRALEVAVGCD
jgi:mRNA interferase MazF